MFKPTHSQTVLRYGAALTLAMTGLAGQAAHANDLNPILGGGLGAMAGAFIGQSVGGRDGAMVGAAVGGLAGVGIASQGERHRQETVRTVVSVPQHRPQPAYAPVYSRPVYAAPVVVVPAQRYREVERVHYYQVRDHGRRSWGEPGRGHGARPWGHHDEYRYDGHGGGRGGNDRGWDRRD